MTDRRHADVTSARMRALTDEANATIEQMVQLAEQLSQRPMSDAERFPGITGPIRSWEEIARAGEIETMHYREMLDMHRDLRLTYALPSTTERARHCLRVEANKRGWIITAPGESEDA
jgi:hypothetical protein